MNKYYTKLRYIYNRIRKKINQTQNFETTYNLIYHKH